MTTGDILGVIQQAENMARQYGTRHSVVDRAGLTIVIPATDAGPNDTILETVRPPKVDRFGRVFM